MKWIGFILVAALCFSCGNQSVNNTGVSNDPLYYFNDFPDSLFLGIYFDQPIDEARNNLEQNGFELLDSSGSWSYLNKKDSNEIILPPREKLSSFKLIMKSARILKSPDLLHNLFRQKATSAQRSADFSVYHYNQKKSSFKVSIFKQEEFIRLSFEERVSK